MKNVNELYNTMPACLYGSACEDTSDVDELIDLARTQVDLSEEGQDGAITPREAKQVKRWIQKARGEK